MFVAAVNPPESESNQRRSTKDNPFFAQYSIPIAGGIAGLIMACIIELSGVFFQIIARQITNWEHPRTQADYENSYTFKMFLFQFINYYASLIYTAFFKVSENRRPGTAKF